MLCLEFCVAVTCLLFDEDPKTVVLYQKELCLHFVKILETNLIAQFPFVFCIIMYRFSNKQK